MGTHFEVLQVASRNTRRPAKLTKKKMWETWKRRDNSCGRFTDPIKATSRGFEGIT
jgi:hypothetical protein